MSVLHHCDSRSFKLLAQLVILVGHIAHINTILKNITSSRCQVTSTGALLCKRHAPGRDKERKEQGKRDLLPPACCRESACVELSHVAHTDDAQLDGLHFDQSFLVLHAEKNKTLILGAWYKVFKLANRRVGYLLYSLYKKCLLCLSVPVQRDCLSWG